MLSSNWKALIASNKVQVGVSKKRKAEDAEDKPNLMAAAASTANAAAASGPATVTPCLAIDCEFVGVGRDGSENALARVSLVNFHSEVVLDTYVKPTETVTDYRTAVSGIKAAHIHSKGAISFKQCQREVAAIIKDKILVGHAVQNDLQALLLSHPKHLVRDTARYKGLCPDRPRSLKKLVAEVLGQSIQVGSHDSVQDARATLALYKHVRARWEKEIWEKKVKRRSTNTTTTTTTTVSASSATNEAGATTSTLTVSSSSTSVSASAPRSAAVTAPVLIGAHKSKKAYVAAKQAAEEARRLQKQERNQRRKKMRTEQKLEKMNR